MRKSVFSKILVGYIVLVAGLALFIPTYSFGIIREHYLGTVTEHLKAVASVVADDVGGYWEMGRLEVVEHAAKELGLVVHARITVMDREGKVIADSEIQPATMESHQHRPEVESALKGEVGISTRYSTTLKEDMLYVAQPLRKAGSTRGVVRVSVPLTDVRKLFDELKRKIAEATCIAVVVALVGAFLFSRSLTGRMRALSGAVRKVASGDFAAKAFVGGKDEISDLGYGFNTMTDEITTLFRQLSQEKESLSSILASVQEGLLVLDRRERVVLSNESLVRITRVGNPVGKYYWEVIREAKFREVVERVAEKKEGFSDELEIGARSYVCSASYVEGREEIVMVLHDITEMKNIEKMKRDFVVNVSHELRTPLTAIKGFSETLLEEADEESRQYVEVIKRNTDRLINIVEDLLVLSELEERRSALCLEETDVRKVIENVVRIFTQKIETKGLMLTVEAKADLVPIKADAFRLEQMFINLVDNAIKHTEKGSLTISLEQRGGSLVARVKDTGIGIPKEDLPRVFERFYVVDKSRSRQLGGTGLGLSIVKHIVLLHHGKIGVESTPGAGTTVTVTLPMNLA